MQLENFGAVGKNNCRTRDWKICAIRKKGTAVHMAGKFWCRWKKTTAQHVAWKIQLPLRKSLPNI